MNHDGNTSSRWLAANQQYIVAYLALVRCWLERAGTEGITRAEAQIETARRLLPAPSALDMVAEKFGLSPFEQHVLLLCAGVELDGGFAKACAEARGDGRFWQPTFGLALSVLPNGHWSAITPSGALRRHCLIDIFPGDGLSSSPLRIQERVLHYLVGIDELDESLAGLLQRIAPPTGMTDLQRSLALRIGVEWDNAAEFAALPVIELCGSGRAEKLVIAANAVAPLGLHLDVLDAAAADTKLDDERFARIVARDAILSGSALLLDCEEMDEVADASRRRSARRFAERFGGPILVAAHRTLQWVQRNVVTLEVPRSTAFASESANMRGLAERIESNADWEDLVLPSAQRETLREIVVHAQQREHLREQWGFSRPNELGVSALFSGASGTGKTMAAGVIARQLGCSLYRVDLSRLVSKYIGETEKNLRYVFDAAEESDCILLFDEADVLFGARSEVKDSHDRYANLEVAYLLQRMESHRGVSILTTNLAEAIEPALMRRLRFVVTFPFPDVSIREQLWRTVFPSQAPVEAIDYHGLAKLNITGGHIRNIAVAAASLAAGDGGPVTMLHVRRAVRAEYQKLGREVPAGLFPADE